jgi:hypothetical protein
VTDISGAATITSGVNGGTSFRPRRAGSGAALHDERDGHSVAVDGRGERGVVDGELGDRAERDDVHATTRIACGWPATANPSRCTGLTSVILGRGLRRTSWTSTRRRGCDHGHRDDRPVPVGVQAPRSFAVYDDATGANRRVSRYVGAVSHRSIVETPKGTFFLSGDKGVWTTDGNSVTQVSDKITPTLESLVDTAKVNAAGVYFRNHYYLSVCTTGTANNRTLDFDMQLGSWWLHSNGANDASAKVDKCYTSGTYQDNATTFDSYWVSAWHTFGAPYLKKRIRQIHFDGAGTVDLYAAVNFAAGFNLLRSNVFVTDATTFGGNRQLWRDGDVRWCRSVAGSTRLHAWCRACVEPEVRLQRERHL